MLSVALRLGYYAVGLEGLQIKSGSNCSGFLKEERFSIVWRRLFEVLRERRFAEQKCVWVGVAENVRF